MKKPYLVLCVCVFIFLFISATVWEGAAAVATGGELPDNGFYIATNSFPVNTLVDLTNLETGRTVKATAFSGLDTTGILALLSRDAANAIGIEGGTLGRISMSQGGGALSFSPGSDGIITSGDPDFDPAAFVAINRTNPTLGEFPGNERIENGELIVDAPGGFPVYALADANLSFVPAETRPPETGPVPDPRFFIPSITPAPNHYQDALIPKDNYTISYSSILDPSQFVDPIVPVTSDYNASSLSMDPSQFVDPIRPLPPIEVYTLTSIMESILETIAEPVVNPTIEPLVNPAIEPVEYFIPFEAEPAFSAPLITSLEKGSYYLQIASFSREETVQSELSKIDRQLPVAIMNAGSFDKPLYRILIGPVNLGESGALLQRFKYDYKDAFVRQGS